MWSSLIGDMGDAECGLCNAWINSWAAVIAALAEEVFGRAKRVGNHTALLVIRLSEVSLIWVG